MSYPPIFCLQFMTLLSIEDNPVNRIYNFYFKFFLCYSKNFHFTDNILVVTRLCLLQYKSKSSQLAILCNGFVNFVKNSCSNFTVFSNFYSLTSSLMSIVIKFAFHGIYCRTNQVLFVTFVLITELLLNNIANLQIIFLQKNYAFQDWFNLFHTKRI